MDDEYLAYKNDPRIPCSYGRKCYQKNPVHHNKYKHPPDPKRKKTYRNGENEAKKLKLSDDEKVEPKNESTCDSPSSAVEENIQVNNDVSDSDSETEAIQNDHVKTVENIIEESNSKDTIVSGKRCTHSDGHNNGSSREFIKKKFLVDFPNDFYQFYNFCESLKSENPSGALLNIGLELVGPYDILSGKFCGRNVSDDEFLIHWRYFNDPPQMITILKGVNPKGYHIGYFWDSPNEKPVFLVESTNENGAFEIAGENIFAAVSLYLENKIKSVNPFEKMKFVKVLNQIKLEAEKLSLDLSRKTKNISKRNNKILTRTFNKIGLVVPYEKKTQAGYRKLAMSNKDLDAILTRIKTANHDEKPKLFSELQAEILTWTDIATDECDFGTGIELGLNIISHGVEDLNNTAKRLLSSNYKLLKWDAFAKIADAHMNNRRKGHNLSIL